MSENLTYFQNVATAFRHSFETVDLSSAPGFLPKFPEGCCNWASWMIGHYLKFEQQLDPFEAIGERSAPDGLENHSWLTISDVVVDITSDEFFDSSEAVIVSRFSRWHEAWKVVKTMPIRRIDYYDDPHRGRSMLPSDCYDVVAAHARRLLSA